MRTGIVCLLLALMPAVVYAEESPVGMSYVKTKDLGVYYYDSLDFLVPHMVRSYTNSLVWQRKMFGWMPAEPATVMMQDFSDYAKAFTFSAPRSTVIFDVAPQSHAFETYPASERIYTLMNHEAVHLATGDVTSDEDKQWRRLLFGKVSAQPQNPESLLYSYLTVPRFTAPRWYMEGSAVFMETWMSGGLGRAQGGYDEMVFRAKVRDGAQFYDPLGLESRGTRVDFQVGANAYLYGTRFFTWLAIVYSPEKVVAWLRRDAGSARNYADQFQQVFGIALEPAWQSWIAFEREFQQRNLAEIRKFPVTMHQTLAARALGSISRTFYDPASGILYGAFRYPGVVEHVGALNTRDGSIRQLADIKLAMHYRVTSFAFDPASGTAFYTNDNLAWRDLMSVDVKTGEVRTLIENGRIGEIVFNPADRSLMGVRHNNGLATLVRIPHPYDLYYPLHTFPYEMVPTDLDISRDGKLLSASVSEITGDQFMRVWELDKVIAGDLKPLSEFRFGQSVPESFTFSADGRYLFGSSYYTGVSNIFRYEVATGAVEAVSNADSGYFRPVPLADGRLVVLTYTGEGFVPAIIEPRLIKDISAIKFLGAELAARHPVVTTWQVPSPSIVDYDKQVVEKGVYKPLSAMELENAYPVLQGYKNSAGIGYHIGFSDPLQFMSLGITGAYTPSMDIPRNERGHLSIVGRYRFWRAELSWNNSDFYDLFGPTKRSRKGNAAKLGYDDPLIWDEPRKLVLKYDLNYYDKIDTLPNAQKVDTNFTRLLTGEIGLNFTDVRRSLGAVDDEKGLAWSAVATANKVSGDIIPQLRGSLDIGFALPIAHSSIWLRGVAGAAHGDRGNSVANFYFGGFGNNYVDSGSIKRYQEYYALPGFGINEVSGQTFMRQMVELNLPPVVFESVGTPRFHATWLRPSLFASALWTDPQHSSLRKHYASIGAQADLRFSVLHWYDVTLSFGYAVGYQRTRRAGDEVMFSLKIM